MGQSPHVVLLGVGTSITCILNGDKHCEKIHIIDGMSLRAASVQTSLCRGIKPDIAE
jgi:hypothetical protein